jgi:hypothetical protein
MSTINETAAALSWNKELSQFLSSIGLVETSECLESELIVLSRHHLEKLPEALESLVEKLLISLERHVNAKEQIVLEKQPADDKIPTTTQQHADLLTPTKRKRFENEQEEALEQERDRVKRLDGEQIQIRATTEEVDQRINTFIQAKQNELDESNRTEFLSRHDPKADDVTCARTDAREINRNIQMKFDIVNNEDGPLARSLTAFNDNKNSQAATATATSSNNGSGGADATERVNNIEQHLNVRLDDNAKPPFSIFERIKILENTLMEIEHQYPTWAAVHFNQPNRNFPPPPPIKYITRPANNTAAVDQLPQPQPPIIPVQDDEKKDATYVSTQITTTAPLPQQRMLKAQGRANSSLTRAVIDQLNRQSQVSVTRQMNTMK